MAENLPRQWCRCRLVQCGLTLPQLQSLASCPTNKSITACGGTSAGIKTAKHKSKHAEPPSKPSLLARLDAAPFPKPATPAQPSAQPATGPQRPAHRSWQQGQPPPRSQTDSEGARRRHRVPLSEKGTQPHETSLVDMAKQTTSRLQRAYALGNACSEAPARCGATDFPMYRRSSYGLPLRRRHPAAAGPASCGSTVQNEIEQASAETPRAVVLANPHRGIKRPVCGHDHQRRQRSLAAGRPDGGRKPPPPAA